MNIFKLSFLNLKFRGITNLFNITILAFGITIISTVFLLNDAFEKKFLRDLQGIDLVVGAKGSPLQLILSSVFHLDVPTGNIEFEEVEKLQKNPLIKSIIPIALGDNYRGFRIVGAERNYIEHYQGKIAQGNFARDEMEIVIGAEIAKKYQLNLGDKITGAHGLSESDDLHEDSPYKISGILQPSGNVLDRLIITPIESVWHVHDHDEEEEEHEEDHQEKEITAALISFKTPLAIVSLPREINQNTNLQAASPTLEITRLVRIFDIGFEAIKFFGLILIIISASGFFIILLNIVNDGAYDIALMRSLGASRSKITKFVLAQGLILGIISAIIGLGLSRILIYLAKSWLWESKNLAFDNSHFSIFEFYIFISALLLSLVAAIIPAFIAYKSNITKTLSKS
jgi:putative ABC transport system permease protein